MGCHLKQCPGTQHSDSPPRVQLSQRYKSPTLLWVVITISSRFCFLVLFSFLFYLIDLRRERNAGHSQSQVSTSVFRGQRTWAAAGMCGSGYGTCLLDMLIHACPFVFLCESPVGPVSFCGWTAALAFSFLAKLHMFRCLHCLSCLRASWSLGAPRPPRARY